MRNKFLLFTAFSILLTAMNTEGSILIPKIKGIASVTFYTKDVESNLLFYSEYLGFDEPVVERFNVKDTNTIIKINNKQFIHLIQQKKETGSRLAYFSIEVANAKAMRKYLSNKGIETTKQPLTPINNSYSFFIKDPNGTLIQFIQRISPSHPTEIQSTTSPNKIADKISHVGFMVAEVNKEIDFYVNILGFKEIWRGSKDGKNVTWINLALPNSTEYIELMLYDQVPTLENMGVLNHICLEVTDLPIVSTRLSKRSLPKGNKLTTPIKIGVNKKRQINCFDKDGTRVEIMENRTFDGLPAKSSTAPPLKFINN